MARIKIKDLPKDMQISQQEMRSVLGGEANPQPSPRPIRPVYAPMLFSTKFLIGMDPQPSP